MPMRATSIPTMLINRLKTWFLRRLYRYMNRKAWQDHLLPPTDVSNLRINLGEQVVPLRVYHGSGDRPLIIYFHGGGWVIGDVNTHDPFCKILADRSDATVISVDYRLAPEHPFPAAHDDCLAASRWILDHLNALPPNNGKVVLSGDSAGGNLAICTALALHGEPRLSGCLAIYPAITHYHAGLKSYTEHAKTGPLTTPIMRWFIDTYLAETAPADPSTERIFPGRRTGFQGLPRTLIVTAERDPLRDDGKRLALHLQKAGVDVTHQHFPNEAHGFACSEGPTEGHDAFMALATRWLREGFNRPASTVQESLAFPEPPASGE